MTNLLTSFIGLTFFLSVTAQKDPEFPKGWVMYIHGHQGIATNFTASPDLYVGGLGVSPQATIVPGYLRVGATAGAIFSNKKTSGAFGPNLALKLASLTVQQLGSLLNVQLQLEHLWGTDKQKLIGGLLQVELGQLLQIGFSTHRDYVLNNWLFQGGIGYNLLRKKKKGLEDPLQ